MFPLRGALAAAGLLTALLTTAPAASAAGPATYGITPNKGTSATGITATFSFKTDTAAACTAQQVRFYWDGAYWGSASTTWIGGNRTCTGDGTLRPPSGATPGVHQTSATDSSGADSSSAAPFLLLNPDGSAPTPTAAPAPGGSADPANGGGVPVGALVGVGVTIAVAVGSSLFLVRSRRGARVGTRRS